MMGINNISTFLKVQTEKELSVFHNVQSHVWLYRNIEV